ncbi:MAG TPA: transporter substrate-binding domain-containing protein, partial [Kiritimatiellia bacterium]|nr:transporter substrate-binding domain-containing protein [Kiritimatiellia bacterium]
MAFLPVLALLAAHVSGCRTPLASSAALRIGTVRDAPPLICRQKGRWTGLEADLGRNLAARLGMKPVFIPLPAERLTDALLTGKVDMLMAGLTITDTRRLQMDFSLPYLVVGQAALIRSEDLLRYN